MKNIKPGNINRNPNKTVPTHVNAHQKLQVVEICARAFQQRNACILGLFLLHRRRSVSLKFVAHLNTIESLRVERHNLSSRLIFRSSVDQIIIDLQHQIGVLQEAILVS